MRITRRTRRGSISMGLGGWIAYGLFMLPPVAAFIVLQVTAAFVVVAAQAAGRQWRRRKGVRHA